MSSKVPPLKSVREQERILFSLGLGISAVFVFFVATEAFEVKGTNSLQEIVAGSLIGGTYLAFCQFWMSPCDRRSFREKLPAMAALNAPVLALAALAILGNNLSPVPGLPWLLSGCLGTLGGDLAAMRLSDWLAPKTPPANPLDPLRHSRRSLQLAVVLLLSIALFYGFGVLPPLLADHTAGFNAKSVALFLDVTVAFNLLAAWLVLKALRSQERDRFFRVTLGVPVFLALLLGLIYVFASGIRSQSPDLGTASVLLGLCAALDFGAMALVAAVSLMADLAARKM
jgi:hypothetical protein